MSYKGTIDLISGIRAKNNGKFALIRTEDIYYNNNSRAFSILHSHDSDINALKSSCDKIVSKNLLDIEKNINNIIVSNTTGIETIQNGYCTTDYIQVVSGNHLVLTYNNSIRSIVPILYVSAYDKNGILLPSSGYSNITSGFDISENVEYIRITYSNEINNDVMLSIEESDNAISEYEPYTQPYYVATEKFLNTYLPVSDDDDGNSDTGDISGGDSSEPINIHNTFNIVHSIPITVSLKDNWNFCKLSDVANRENDRYFTDDSVTLNDAELEWTNIAIPHDWSIRNNFNSASPSTHEGGFLDGGDAWYKRIIHFDNDITDKEVILNFDGIYKNSAIYVNDTRIHNNYFGYNPIEINITDYIHTGDNTILVFVRNEQPSSRWYSGSGIYRNANLIIRDKSDVIIDTVQITTPRIRDEYNKDYVTTRFILKLNNKTNSSIDTNISISINNESKTIINNLYECSVNVGNNVYIYEIKLYNPKLWDSLNGNTYEAVINVNGANVNYTTLPIKYGYRYAYFDESGFYLNGRKIFLKGVCLHHDLGILGAEVNSSAIERQIDLLIDMGCNAIRLTHNPASKEMIDICTDRGILLIEELFDCWSHKKKEFDFGNDFVEHKDEVIDSVMRRDRNNPAIIMWSIGNEIFAEAIPKYTAGSTVPIARSIINRIRVWDNRAVTLGGNGPLESVENAVYPLLDVIGLNYADNNKYNTVRATPELSGKAIYGSETTSAVSTRGKYAIDYTNKYRSSLDNDTVAWGSFACDALRQHMQSDYLCGMFVWTGFDYIGEPTPFNAKNAQDYPSRSSYFGIIDIAGIPKDSYYLYQSVWSDKPMIHVFPRSWKADNNSNRTIYCYSNCDIVSIYLNGNLVQSKTKTQRSSEEERKMWYKFDNIPYENGTLEVRGYDNNGTLLATDAIKTSNEISSLKLTPLKDSVNIRTDDISFVMIEALDSDGNAIPDIDGNDVTVTCTGGTIIGTDNGNSAYVENNLRSNIKPLFSGKLVAMIKHDGVAGYINISATSESAHGNAIISKTTSDSNNVSDFSLLKDYISNLISNGYFPGSSPGLTIIDCESITLDNSSISLINGNSCNLIANVVPSDCTKPIIWESSNKSIATVSNKGLITSVGTGSCTITAKCGNKTATCTVSIEDPIVYNKNEVYYVAENLVANGAPYIYSIPSNFSFSSGDVVEVSLDLSSDNTNKDAASHLFTVGLTPHEWNGYNLLLYYNDAKKQLTVQTTTFSPQPQCQKADFASNGDNKIIRFDNNGISINNDYVLLRQNWGEPQPVPEGLRNTLNMIDSRINEAKICIGTEGNNASYATYNYIKIYNSNNIDSEGNPVVLCESISIDNNSIPNEEIKVGDIFTINSNVVPTNCSQEILYSSSNTNVATVDLEGTVTIVGEGSTTITVTCGNHSDSINMNATGFIPSDILYDNIIYMTSNRVLVAGNQDYIDTDIKLFDENKSWTIMLDYSGSSSNTFNENAHCLMHCMEETSPWNGLSFAIWRNDGYGVNFYNDSIGFANSAAAKSYGNNKYEANANRRAKIIFAHEAGTSTIKSIFNDSEKGISNIITATANNLASINKTLLIGCFQQSNGVKGRFWNGTIHNLVIWDEALNDTQILQISGF